MADSQTHTIKGILKKVKEDGRTLVYGLECHIQGISGSIYIDRTYAPLFDRLVMDKKEVGNDSTK